MIIGRNKAKKSTGNGTSFHWCSQIWNWSLSRAGIYFYTLCQEMG